MISEIENNEGKYCLKTSSDQNRIFIGQFMDETLVVNSAIKLLVREQQVAQNV